MFAINASTMNKRNFPIRRRNFLQSSVGLAGAAAWFGAIGTAQAAKPLYPTREGLEKVLGVLEAQDERMFVINRQEGLFLHLLAKMTGARNVLEIGTAHGYWTIWLAAALESTGGKLTTIEIKPERVIKSKEHLAKAGLTRGVTFLEGNAHEVVPKLKGQFDLVFLNADKSGLMDYFKKLHPARLRPGAVLLVTNAVQRRDDMKEYLEAVAKHPDFDALVLSVTTEDAFSFARQR